MKSFRYLYKTFFSYVIQRYHGVRGLIIQIYKADYKDGLNQLDKRDVVFFCHDNNRPLNVQNKAFSPLSDSLRNDFESKGLKCCSIALPWSSLVRSKGYGEPVSFNLAYLRYKVLKKIFRWTGLNSEDISDLYSLILDKTTPKLIVTIGSPIELAAAARRKEILHVELLHGIGYTKLPWGWDRLPKNLLPQGILSLDEVSTLTFKHLLAKGLFIKTIPHPFLRLFVSETEGPYKEWIYPKISNSERYLKHVIVILTSRNSKFDLTGKPATILKNGLFYDEIGQLVAEEKEIFWHFRLHPIQLRSPVFRGERQFLNEFVSRHSNADWVNSSNLPLPSIARLLDCAVSMTSMSSYELAAMGVPTLLMCPTIQKGAINQDKFTDLESEGYVTKSTINKEMLRNWVHQTEKMKPRLSNIDDDGAWEDAVEWMLRKSDLDARIKRRA